ncbi:MAG: Asp-tRNA(Asn)/Glu-tRNA(Gln) amidotransferase GatCAB subunit A [Elusimicrobia bacterium HGW-Elusimicrobia-2]|nr:MAG: Asp-tRNA(Asn)/Glu-tRNA(Gln) amidotransferase GatCAB subunit A [Elusimicrobia bacterium HGW-Elusimicrobia-2]
MSVKENISSCIERIKRDKTNSFIEIFEKRALRKAEGIDSRLASGDRNLPLAGEPVAIKDNMVIKGEAAGCASRILEGFVSPYDAEVVTRLENAGAVIVGRTNMDEFAMGSSTETSAFGPTRNPVDMERVPGGSSGGSAAAVASGLVPYSLGSDTGGSIRQPASFCGICGMKPTYGVVSRYGLIAFASSLDQIGPFAKDMDGIEKIFNIIAGKDEKDETSREIEKLSGKKGKLVCGIPKEFSGSSPEVKEVFDKAVKKLSRDFEIIDVSLPSTEYAVSIYYIIAPSEASSNLSRFDGIRYGFRAESEDLIDGYFKTRGQGFGDEVKRRIMLGAFALSSGYYDAYYMKALKVRRLIKNEFDSAFQKADVIISPTSPRTAFKLGEITDPLSLYLQDVYTIPANMAGLPAVSIPCGKDPAGLPVGFQIMAPRARDIFLIETAKKFEAVFSNE